MLTTEPINSEFKFVKQLVYISQVAAVQTGAMQLSVDIFNATSPGHYTLKTDIQIKDISVTKVYLFVL